MLAPTSTTQDAPGAEETDCHHAEMDLISSQPLSEGLFLFWDGFCGSNALLKVTINPIPECPTAGAVPQGCMENKNNCGRAKAPSVAFLQARDDQG